MEKRIGFGRRLGAYAIDLGIIIGLGYIFASVAGDWLERFVDFSKMNEQQINAVSSSPIMWTFSIIFPVAVVFVTFLYNLIEGFTGYTIGKLILNLQIGNQDGTPASVDKLILRFALKNINTLFGLIGFSAMMSTINNIGGGLGLIVFAGCFFALGTKKLALHDMIVKTAVFRKNELEDGTATQSTIFME